jgi:predicted branched-subunit amino acid permease
VKVRFAIRNWWPVLLFAAISLGTQAVFTANVVAIGQHASDHLRSATAPFAMAFLFAIIVWSAPKARRQVDVWAAGAILGVAASLVLFGNLRVISAIAGEAWTDTQANALGPARPGFESGHSQAEFGGWVTLAAVIALTIVLLIHGVVRRGPAIAAVVLSLVVPAFLIPGAGIFVLAGDVGIQRAHRLKRSAKPGDGPSTTPVSRL